MDSFDFALGAIFSHIKEDNFLHPIGFHFHKFFSTKINDEIHDKEILAIMDVFQEWHHLFEKAQHEIIVYYNHKNLSYFMIVFVLNRYQVHWALFLFQFHFVIT
jgi:hypothetical protein